jgi:hypothetical protein
VCFVPKIGVLFQIVQRDWNNIKPRQIVVFISLFIFILYIVPMFQLFQELYNEGQIYILTKGLHYAKGGSRTDFFARNKNWNNWNIGTKLIKPTFLLEHYRNNTIKLEH